MTAATSRVRTWGACAALTVTLALPAAGQGQDRSWPSERPPRPLAPHDVTFPPYAFRTLANGLQVLAVSHHEQPAVSLRLLVRAGSAQDPASKPGVASLVASLLDQGTTTKSAGQIATSIDSIGGALGTGASADLTSITCVVMKDSLGAGLDLVSDLAEHPAFAKDEVERQRQQALSGMQVSNDDPEYLATSVFDRLVYGLHPYGQPQSGTPAAIAALTREDLVAFHRAWFGANNAILAVVGDVTPDEAFAGAERAFGSWTRSASAAARPIEPPAPVRRLLIVDKPGSVQTEIRVGNIGIPRKHADYMALDLAIKVLGGEGANRLHRVLRSERGLTYGASADFNGLEDAGDIVAQTNTRTETTGEALRLMIDEFWKLQRERVGARELQGAQQYLTGSFPLTIETPSQIATQILNAVFYGLDLNDLQTYRERVNAVTVDDIQRVAKRYLHPDQLTIVLVGDASAFVKQLPAAGFDTFDRIALADLDVSSPDLRRKRAAADGGALRPAMYLGSVRAGARQPDNAKALVDQAIRAKGGLAKLQKIRTLRAESTTTIQSLKGPIPLGTVAWLAYPDRFRQESEMPGGKLTQVYAGGTYWIRDSDGVHEAPPDGGQAILAGLRRDTISVLVKLGDGTLSAREVPSEDPQLGAVLISGDGLNGLTLFVNRDNGLIAKVRYEDASPDPRLPAQANRIVVEEQYSDYRNVDGIQVAFHTVLHRPGVSPIERDVKTIHFNVPIPAGLFVKPS